MSEKERNLEPSIPIIHYSFFCDLSILASCIGFPHLAPVSPFYVCISKFVLHLSVFPPTALTTNPPAGYNTRSMLQIRSLSYSPPSSSRSCDPAPLFRCTAPPLAVRLPSSPGTWTVSCLQRQT
jgi:hypothetical protein